jgi:hypothetical protein
MRSNGRAFQTIHPIESLVLMGMGGTRSPSALLKQRRLQYRAAKMAIAN